MTCYRLQPKPPWRCAQFGCSGIYSAVLSHASMPIKRVQPRSSTYENGWWPTNTLGAVLPPTSINGDRLLGLLERRSFIVLINCSDRRIGSLVAWLQLACVMWCLVPWPAIHGLLHKATLVMQSGSFCSRPNEFGTKAKLIARNEIHTIINYLDRCSQQATGPLIIRAPACFSEPALPLSRHHVDTSVLPPFRSYFERKFVARIRG